MNDDTTDEDVKLTIALALIDSGLRCNGLVTMMITYKAKEGAR